MQNKNLQSLLGIQPENQTQANDLQGVALQTLYEKLQDKGHVDSVSIFESHPPAETITEHNRLLLKKVVALVEAV